MPNLVNVVPTESGAIGRGGFRRASGGFSFGCFEIEEPWISYQPNVAI